MRLMRTECFITALSEGSKHCHKQLAHTDKEVSFYIVDAHATYQIMISFKGLHFLVMVGTRLFKILTNMWAALIGSEISHGWIKLHDVKIETRWRPSDTVKWKDVPRKQFIVQCIRVLHCSFGDICDQIVSLCVCLYVCVWLQQRSIRFFKAHAISNEGMGWNGRESLKGKGDLNPLSYS